MCWNLLESMKVKKFWFLMVMCLCSVSFGQMPTMPPGGILPTPTCITLQQQIAGKQSAIAILTTRITTNEAAGIAAQNSFVQAMQNLEDHPAWFTMYYSQATYYLAQVVYYAGEVSDDTWLRNAKQAELDALQQAYVAAGC